MQQDWEAALIEGASELGLELTGLQTQRLVRYLQELLLWNETFNLISPRTTPEAAIGHALDCLSVVPHLRGRSGPLIDLGSGGGLPAIPLKIVLPDLEVRMVESTRKKASFLHQAIRLLDLRGVSVLQERAERLSSDPGSRGTYPIVTSRATFHLNDLLRIAAPFLAPGGILIAMKGPRPEGEIREAESNRAILGLASPAVHAVFLPRGGGSRTILIYGLGRGASASRCG
ncbi:MAG TPA: 16S rRNA (guanine(527)-N(7))-methyltransferase RsmG [Syntrophales bacterium]|nr:16S rRNA (guanine(527)-N(7))-methyltransferase RsmG [Syntrophales bacterium]